MTLTAGTLYKFAIAGAGDPSLGLLQLIPAANPQDRGLLLSVPVGRPGGLSSVFYVTPTESDTYYLTANGRETTGA